jgi:hypothetical protein
MSYGQYSWLITIKNGASHPMVHRDENNNHYKDPYYGWDDHQPYSDLVSIDHGSYGDLTRQIAKKRELTGRK